MQSCATNPVKKEFAGAPDWVTKDCAGYFIQKTGHPALCGVGSAAGADPGEALIVAKTKAKADISKKLSTRIESVLTDYRSSVSNTAGSIDTQHIEEVIVEISNNTLSGIEMTDSWTSPNGTLYVLMSLETEQYIMAVDRVKGIPEDKRRALIEKDE
ncbi:MAG TPA: LPP20 family lipoprotein [Desulfomonilia bacterium]